MDAPAKLMRAGYGPLHCSCVIRVFDRRWRQPRALPLARDKLLLYTQKTGVPVYVPLPSFVVEALHSMPSTYKGREDPASERYFFWTGRGILKSAVADWQRAFRKLFKLAGL